ncbi:hypothetical protein L2E82_18397 [Cichorium intybus]|uniref:Uncharacterized protein n=1 Tax=Cichorium intybus TaxID=13427 RepID=A0ACB9FAP6_CICIN|nr:hypothetical protein L2E82_18397 [Cichorium intybus]
MEELVRKLELSNSEVTKELHDLRSSTESFNSQYHTGFAKHLSDAHKRVEELTTELSSSAVTTFAKELRTTNQTIITNMVNKLKTALQPMINVSLKMERSMAERGRPQQIAQGEHNVHPSQGGESEATGSQALETPTSEAHQPTTTEPQTTSQPTMLGRPSFIPPIPSTPSMAIPTFGSTITTEAGGSSSQPLRKEIRIAPHMEQVNRERKEEYRKILEINRIAINNETWTEDLIKTIGFTDFHVNNSLPLKSLDTKNSKDQQLDLPYNPKTFAFLQFERHVPKEKEKLTEFKVRKITFHTKYIQAPAYVWSVKKIVKIISIKKGEEYVGFQNLNFFVLRGVNEEESKFTIADFPIMNPSDFISLLDILKFSAGKEQIVDKPWGVVFKGLSHDNETMVTKFFDIDFMGRFPTESVKQVLALVNNCFVNTWQEKKKLREHLNWWLTVRYTLKQAFIKHLRQQR